jgi:hypothetical protein
MISIWYALLTMPSEIDPAQNGERLMPPDTMKYSMKRRTMGGMPRMAVLYNDVSHFVTLPEYTLSSANRVPISKPVGSAISVTPTV